MKSVIVSIVIVLITTACAKLWHKADRLEREAVKLGYAAYATDTGKFIWVNAEPTPSKLDSVVDAVETKVAELTR
jgi:hypothetical protein